MIEPGHPQTPPDLDPHVQSTLRQIDDALLRSPVPEEFFPEFDRIASNLLRYDRMAISFCVNRRFQAKYAYVSGTEIENFEQGSLHDIIDDNAVSWFSRKKAERLAGNDLPGGGLVEGYNWAARSAGLNSVIVAPIRWRGNSIGDLMLCSRGVDAYSDRDLAIADMLANKISGVVANDQAASEAQLESNLRESLMEFSRLVSSVRTLQEVHQQFGELACSLVEADRVTITVPNETDRIIEHVMVYGHHVEGYGFGSHTLLDDLASIPWLKTTIPYIVDDELCNRSPVMAESEKIATDAGLRSALIAPVVWRGEPIASINFRSETERAFNKHHLETAAAIANQVAGAIASQIAYEDLARKSRERDALALIGRSVSSAHSLEETFDQFAKVVAELIPWDRITITTLTGEDGQAASVFQAGAQSKETKTVAFPTLLEDFTELFRERPTPVIIDVDRESKYVDFKRVKKFADADGLRSWLAAPLVWRSELLGTIHFRSTTSGAYDKSHLRIAAEIANQIAGSIASNITFQKLKEEATIRDVLAELSNAVGSSDDLATVLPQIETLTGSLIKFDGFTIGTYDDERELYRDVYSQGAKSKEQPDGPVFPISDVIAGEAIKLGQIENVSVGSIDQVRHRPRSAGAYQAGVRTFLTAPLSSNDRVVGALQLRSKIENAYNEQHVELIKRIANQIAGAFANSLATEQIRVQATALESADNAIVITDTVGIIEWANTAFTKMYGWSLDEVIGRHTSIMKSTNPADQSTNDEIWEALGRGRSWSGTHSSRKKDGSEFPEEITVTPVFDQDGEIIRLIGIKQDITERVLAEQQHEDAIRIESENRELQRVAAARSEFLSTVSHELRTPLTTVSAFTDILFNSKSENLTGRQRTHLGLIRKSSNQLKSLIDDLLDVSQASGGRLVLNKVKFRLEEMVDEVADLSRVLLSKHDQSLELTNHDSRVFLHADRSRVIQILTNLLTNASKFSDEGSKVRLDVLFDAGHVTFNVTDSGVGITKVDQAKMFSPFYRGASAGSADTVGSGLGLSVVQSLVDLHDGSIAVDSQRGKGTTITVKLPGATSAPA